MVTQFFWMLLWGKTVLFWLFLLPPILSAPRQNLPESSQASVTRVGYMLSGHRDISSLSHTAPNAMSELANIEAHNPQSCSVTYCTCFSHLEYFWHFMSDVGEEMKKGLSAQGLQGWFIALLAVAVPAQDVRAHPSLCYLSQPPMGELFSINCHLGCFSDLG